MKPGRELDAKVAEVMGLNVLGFTPCVPNPECYGYFVPMVGKGTVEQPVYLKKCFCEISEKDDAVILGHNGLCLEIVPHYSTDIAAAWQAWEWLEENRYKLLDVIELALTRDRETLKPTICGCIRRSEPEWCISGESYPHAICLAILEAKGVIDETGART